MKALLVTSRVTFVPENYAALVSGLAPNPHIGALLILENRDFTLFAKGFAAFALRRAPHIGLELMKNSIQSFRDSREESFRQQNKPVFSLSDINSSAAVDLIRSERIDLIVNARTRFIYKEPILQAPRLGCINIHHGLLPQQRGVFCDLWALAQGRPAGFSIHKMTPKLDDGEILAVVENTRSFRGRFVDYAYESSKKECLSVETVLNNIASAQTLSGTPNTRDEETRYFKNPTPQEIKQFRSGGLLL